MGAEMHFVHLAVKCAAAAVLSSFVWYISRLVNKSATDEVALVARKKLILEGRKK